MSGMFSIYERAMFNRPLQSNTIIALALYLSHACRSSGLSQPKQFASVAKIEGSGLFVLICTVSFRS